jgi:hypothetical protein
MKQMGSGSVKIGNRTLLLALHTREAPTNEQWNAYLEMISGVTTHTPFGNVVGLAITDGGAPDARQRALGAKFLPSSTSVVTTSAFARGVVTAFSWVNPRVKAFHPARFVEALKHLHLENDALSVVVGAIADLQGTMDPVVTVTDIHRALVDLHARVSADVSQHRP